MELSRVNLKSQIFFRLVLIQNFLQRTSGFIKFGFAIRNDEVIDTKLLDRSMDEQNINLDLSITPLVIGPRQQQLLH